MEKTKPGRVTIMETKYIPCENLRINANKIFNGLIEDAYIASDIDDRTKNYFNNLLDIDEQKELCYNAEIIVLKFSNGSIVEFSNSEWGSITKLDSITLIS